MALRVALPRACAIQISHRMRGNAIIKLVVHMRRSLAALMYYATYVGIEIGCTRLLVHVNLRRAMEARNFHCVYIFPRRQLR